MHNTIISRRGHSRSLRNACRKAFAAAIAAFFCLSASYAQEYPNGLSADSVDPEADAAFIREMRQRSDRIRETEQRPVIGLVLSGGGAKGSAHVGVLKLLEELDMPVDMICGTSMGGLIGGLYSLGYPADYLDSLLRSQDWDITLSDKVDPEYITYTAKEYKNRYLLSIPFHYEKGSQESSKRKEVQMTRERSEFNIDASESDLNTGAGMNTFASSLPSGYVYGFNVNNLLSSLSVGYQDSIAFSSLPIPYFCVASDVMSCKAKNWGNGSIKNAMRSTMSIPGMFDPVRTEGMVLVDGGTRNNFPVDLARAMGADYVIGVELSDETRDFDEVKNIGSVMFQMIAMLGHDSFNKNVGGADVFIKPVLTGYNMLSFNPTAIDTMINRGYRAALLQKDRLKAIKSLTGPSGMRLGNRKATDISKEPVQVSEVSFAGLEDVESRILMRKIKLKAGQKVSKEIIDDAMSKLQATGAFETVTYSLLGDSEPYRLVFSCIKGPVHKFGLGFRLDNEQWASLLFNVGLNTGKIKGSKLDVEAKVGQSRYLDVRYALDLPWIPTFNLESRVYQDNGEFISGSQADNYSINFRGYKQSVYLSNIQWTKLDIKAGVDFDYFYTKSLLSDNSMVFDRSALDEYLSGRFVSAVIQGRYCSFDNKFFPSKGTDFNLGGEYIFASPGAKDFNAMPIAYLDFKKVIRMGRNVALIPDLHARTIMTQSNTMCHSNALGGAMAGRHLDQQVPFVGFSDTYIADDQMAVANIDLRVKVTKNFYISALGGYVHQADTFEEFLSTMDEDIYGFGLQAGYNTIFGPIKAIVSRSSITKSAQFYFSAGFDF